MLETWRSFRLLHTKSWALFMWRLWKKNFRSRILRQWRLRRMHEMCDAICEHSMVPIQTGRVNSRPRGLLSIRNTGNAEPRRVMLLCCYRRPPEDDLGFYRRPAARLPRWVAPFDVSVNLPVIKAPLHAASGAGALLEPVSLCHQRVYYCTSTRLFQINVSKKKKHLSHLINKLIKSCLPFFPFFPGWSSTQDTNSWTPPPPSIQNFMIQNFIIYIYIKKVVCDFFIKL